MCMGVPRRTRIARGSMMIPWPYARPPFLPFYGLAAVWVHDMTRMQRMELKAGDVLVREGQPMPGVYW